VTETEPVKLPPLGLIVGVATVGIIVCELTVKLNIVVLVTPPPVAVIVMVELPAGVEPVVLIVKVEEQPGLQLATEREAVVPAGSPAAENATSCVLPDTSVALMVLVAEDPAVTEEFPELLREKLNVAVEAFTVKVKLVVLVTSPAAPVTVIV
jgi:hypothetical protein